MTASVTLIEDQIATIMLAASALDDLNAVIRGVPYRVATQYYPFATVAVVSETTISRLTGNRHERAYAGIIQFETRHQDVESVDDRTARVSSYAEIHHLVDQTVRLFKSEAQRTLGGLSLESGAVTQIVIGDDQIEYGVAPEPGRTDNYRNIGVLPFVVETLEVM